MKNKKYHAPNAKNFYGYIQDKGGWAGTWHEQVVNNISIKKFHFLEEALEWEIPEEPKKLSGRIPFKIWSSAEEVESYITKKAGK